MKMSIHRPNFRHYVSIIIVYFSARGKQYRVHIAELCHLYGNEPANLHPALEAENVGF